MAAEVLSGSERRADKRPAPACGAEPCDYHRLVAPLDGFADCRALPPLARYEADPLPTPPRGYGRPPCACGTPRDRPCPADCPVERLIADVLDRRAERLEALRPKEEESAPAPAVPPGG